MHLNESPIMPRVVVCEIVRDFRIVENEVKRVRPFVCVSMGGGGSEAVGGGKGGGRV